VSREVTLIELETIEALEREKSPCDCAWSSTAET